MKYLKMLGLAAVAAMAFAAFAASSASATTLEVGGVTKNEAITITASLTPNKSATLKDTFGFTSNTCTVSHVHATTTSPYTGTTVTADVETLTFGVCEREGVEVIKGGKLHISSISGTTNGTVTSSGAEVKTPSPFGTLTCVTGEGTHLGTLTGVNAGNAELDVNATLNCSGVSSKWIAEYRITSPAGLGVSG